MSIKFFEENDAELKERYKEHVADFENMKTLALILAEKKAKGLC